MNGNDTFLDVNNAHLRVTSGNVYASAFNLDQIDIVMSSNTASTVNFNNPTKAFNAASNIEVGTANLFVDTTTTRVGVGTASPDANLHVEGDAYVSSNLEVGNSVFPTWYQTIAGSSYESGHSIAVDSSGNVYVTGYYNSTSPVSLGNGLVLPSTYLDDVYIVKYDTSGTAQWYQTIAGRGSPSSRDGGRSIAVDSGGNVYVTGNYNSTTAVSLGNNLSLPFSYGSEAYIVKYDTSGTAQWYQTISGTSFDIGYGIAVDSSGNVYATGRYESSTTTVSLGNGLELPVSSTTDAYIVKYDTSGTAQWYQTIAGSSSDIAFGIAVDSSGSVYATGFYNSTTAVSLGNNLSLPVSSGDDVFIVKYDTSGTAQWYQTISGTSNHTGYGIAVDSGGNVYATGYYNSTTIVSLGNNINLPVSSGNDVFIVKYDTSGTAQWYQTISGTSNNRGYGIAVDSGGNVYATGRYESSTSPVSLGNNINLPVSSTTDAYIVKYNSSGTAQWYQTISGTSSDVGYGIAVDSGGNVYATGYYNSTTTVSLGNGLELPVSSTTDAYIVKYSPNPILFIDATTTRVGVGTASPATTLDVNGTISGNGSGLTALNATNITTGTLDRNTTGSAATLTTPRSIGGVNFDGSADIVPTTFGAATFDTDTLVVDSVNNRVGIGTTSPDCNLEIYGDTSSIKLTRSRNNTNYGCSVDFALLNSASEKFTYGRLTGSIADNTDGSEDGFLSFQVGTNGNMQDNYQEEKMRITNTGNVGIGTVSPQGKLEISADFNHTLDRPFTDQNHYLVLEKKGTKVFGTGAGISFAGSYHTTQDYQTNYAVIKGVSDGTGGNSGIGRLEFYTNSGTGTDADRMSMAINADGNVGIGTTNPSTELQIGNTSTKTSDTYLTIASDGGSAYAQGIRLIHHGTDDSNMYGWRIRGDDTDGCFHINYINGGSHQTSALTIKNNGIVTTPSRPAFYAWDNSTSRSGTTLTFNSTTYNIGSHYNTSTSRFKTPVAGTYIFAAVLAHDTANEFGDAYFSFYVDGVLRRDILEGMPIHDGHYETHAVYIVNLSANQYVDIRARSGTNITFINGNHGAYYRNCFQGALLG